MPDCVAVRVAFWVSVAVRDSLVSTVSRVAVKWPMPLLRVALAGRRAAASLLVKWTVPL